MKRVFALALSLALLLCGCNRSDEPYQPTGDALDSGDGSTVQTTPPVQQQTFSMAYHPGESMNPYTATDYTNRALFPLMYQGLFSVDRNYNAVPILCQRYEMSQDMKTFTFYLANALFSDGSALTAQDVVASLQAAQAGNYYKGRFQHVTSIVAGENCVILQMDTPYAYQQIPLLLDIPIVKAGQTGADLPLGTGPYVMEQSVTTGAILRRQVAWWCAQKASLVVTAASIPLVEATTPDEVQDEFELADVGLVCADPGSDHYADFRGDYESWDCETGVFLYLVTNSKSRVFSNAQVRSALTHAIHRDLLVEENYRGFAMSATLPASPLSPYYNATLASRYTYDPEKFKSALETAGLQGAEVKMLLNSDDSLRLRVGRRVAQMLRDCGLIVTVSEMKSNDFLEHVQWGTYDLYMAQTKLSPNMDLTAFFKPWGALSYGGLSNNTAAYALSLKALENSGNFYNLHELVMEDGQLCPILVRSYAVYGKRGLVTALTPSRDNLFYYNVGRSLADAQA